MPNSTNTVLSFRPIGIVPDVSPEWSSRLMQAGIALEEIPLLEISATPGMQEFCLRASELPADHWLIFTSKNAAHLFLQACAGKASQRIACVGLSTAEIFDKRSIPVDFVASEGDGESLALGLCEFLKREPRVHHMCFLKGQLASSALADTLRASGHKVEEHVIYDSLPRSVSAAELEQMRAAVSQKGAVLMFSNAESVRLLVEKCEAWGLPLKTLQACQVAAIGSQTAAKLQDYGFKVDFLPSQPSLDNLVTEIILSADKNRT